VNYGKGWRPRFFLLDDGVLSYYKTNGRHHHHHHHHHRKKNTPPGEDISRWISRLGNPIGEIHLKVNFKKRFFYNQIA